MLECYERRCADVPHGREGRRAVRRSSLSVMELRDLPSVDELARGVDDPLAVDAARTVLERAREEIRAGADPGDLARAAARRARAPRARRGCGAC